MIKWFDVNEFLPGVGKPQVLVRSIIHDVINRPFYDVGFYVSGQWQSQDHAIEDDAIRVTHWAFIEEPL